MRWNGLQRLAQAGVDHGLDCTRGRKFRRRKPVAVVDTAEGAFYVRALRQDDRLGVELVGHQFGHPEHVEMREDELDRPLGPIRCGGTRRNEAQATHREREHLPLELEEHTAALCQEEPPERTLDLLHRHHDGVDLDPRQLPAA